MAKTQKIQHVEYTALLNKIYKVYEVSCRYVYGLGVMLNTDNKMNYYCFQRKQMSPQHTLKLDLLSSAVKATSTLSSLHHAQCYLFVFCLFCCFTSQVISYSHGGTVSSPIHTFFLGKLKQAVNQYFLHILSLVTDNNPS